jgi:hypothetical protein
MALPGAISTKYTWVADGWLTPLGLKMDSEHLIARVVDEAL